MLKKVMKVLMSVLCTMEFVGTKVLAEEALSPTITQDTGNLTIKYFDDSEETIPAEGTEFTVYQIASIGKGLDNNGAYIYLDDTISLDGVVDDVTGQAALDYEKLVLAAYEKNPSLGFTGKVTIGKDGKGVFKDIPIGAYIITETNTTRYHIRSIPFIVSVPEMNEAGNGWLVDVTANPKQILAGDWTISKQVIGHEISKNASYTLKLSMEAGRYKYQNSNGTTGYVQNNSKIKIKNNETITILDLPAGTKCSLKEEEENIGFDTTYTNKEVTIKEKTYVSTKVVNDSSRYDTGAANKLLYYLVAAGGALAVITVLIFIGKRKNKGETETKV